MTRHYRASNTRATFLPAWAHSNRIETVVWVIPCLILISLGTIAHLGVATGNQTQGAYEGISANYSGAGFFDIGFTALAMSRNGSERWFAIVRRSRRMPGQDEYKALAKANKKSPAEYFSSVMPDLFAAILAVGEGVA